MMAPRLQRNGAPQQQEHQGQRDQRDQDLESPVAMHVQRAGLQPIGGQKAAAHVNPLAGVNGLVFYHGARDQNGCRPGPNLQAVWCDSFYLAHHGHDLLPLAHVWLDHTVFQGDLAVRSGDVCVETQQYDSDSG